VKRETVDVPELRAELMAEGLDTADLKPDPLDQLEDWLAFAVGVGIYNANSMAVATADIEGAPSVRNVLYRGLVDGGLVFHTNRQSQKGVELISNPRAEALFSWLALERQVRLRGTVATAPDEVSDAYWDSRPRGSQVAALASDQSRPVPDREWLERRAGALDAAHERRDIPRPEHWGGFVLRPDRVEFWQGREHRLHDRLVYVRQAGQWEIVRLAP
jgi:pyridoxamine 5'-phosphate oxidase